jgi:hypothetical protein
MTEFAANGFRRSHLLRVGISSLDDLDRTVAPFRRPEGNRVFELKFDDIGGGKELLSALRSDYASLLSELVKQDRLLESGWSVDLLQDVQLNPSRKVDAYLQASEDSPLVLISEGLCMALDDTLLTVLCVLGFFTARPGKEEVPESYAIGLCGSENSERYFDYSRTAHSPLGDLPRQLTSHIPLDPVRFAQADLLLSFALHWVALHEQAHWLLGHVKWLQAKHGWTESRIDEVLFLDGSDPEERDDSYCLELQADALATEMLFGYGLSDQILSSQWLTRYRTALHTYGDRRISLAPDLAQRQDRFYMMLLASSISCLLFELRRERLRARSGSHPPPATRLLNIFMAAMETWGDVEEFEGGEENDPKDGYLLAQIRPAVDVAARVFVELEMAAQVIGLESPLYRSNILFRERDEAPNRGDMSPLSDDFFRLIVGSRDLDKYVTDGGRTFVGLLDRSELLYKELKPFAADMGLR